MLTSIIGKMFRPIMAMWYHLITIQVPTGVGYVPAQAASENRGIRRFRPGLILSTQLISKLNTLSGFRILEVIGLFTGNKSVEKVTRGWPLLIREFQSNNCLQGYAYPKGKSPSDVITVRIAFDSDELDILLGRTPWLCYNLAKDMVLRYWMFYAALIPWVIHQYVTEYELLCAILKIVYYGELAVIHPKFMAWAILTMMAAVYVGKLYGHAQVCLVLKIGASSYQSIVQELTNARQEKTDANAVASAPVVTRVVMGANSAMGNASPMDKTQYAIVVRLIAAAYALGVVQLEPGENVPNTGTESLDSEAEVNASNVEAPLVGASEHYRLVADRVSTAPPNTLRESVTIKVKSNDKLFEDRQKGVKVRMKDDNEKLINYSAVIITPELLKVIPALLPCEENEISGAHRHCRKLCHPRTKEFLQMPSAETEARLWLAAQTLAEHLAGKAEEYAPQVSHFKPPEKWSEKMKDTMPELAAQTAQPDTLTGKVRRRMLKGFNKLGELMLPFTKHARLIGNLGPVANMQDAESVGPLEALMKKCYPHLITKALTLDETDRAITRLAETLKRMDMRLESDDYSAMDSSWTVEDRKRLRFCANAALEPIRAALGAACANRDFVLEADEKQENIKWCLKYVEVLMKATDALLFSGERMTSLFNRWLVLLCEFAEEIRCLGEVRGVAMIRHILDGTVRRSIGDGDDNLQGFPKDRYSSAEERVDRFADMYKLLEPCSAWEESTDVEVLSRYHIRAGNDWFHIGKLQRNFGRLIAFKLQRSNVPADVTATAITPKEWAGICTDIWQRSLSLRQTMVVRHFARAVFEHAYARTGKEDGTVYDDDHKRLGRIDGDKKLSECRREVSDAVRMTKASAYAMVKVVHFADFHNLPKSRIKQEIADWKIADNAWSEIELDPKHLLYPETFIEDFPLPVSVAEALGLTDECVQACRKHADEHVVWPITDGEYATYEPITPEVVEIPIGEPVATLSAEAHHAHFACSSAELADVSGRATVEIMSSPWSNQVTQSQDASQNSLLHDWSVDEHLTCQEYRDEARRQNARPSPSRDGEGRARPWLRSSLRQNVRASVQPQEPPGLELTSIGTSLGSESSGSEPSPLVRSSFPRTLDSWYSESSGGGGHSKPSAGEVHSASFSGESGVVCRSISTPRQIGHIDTWLEAKRPLLEPGEPKNDSPCERSHEQTGLGVPLQVENDWLRSDSVAQARAIASSDGAIRISTPGVGLSHHSPHDVTDADIDGQPSNGGPELIVPDISPRGKEAPVSRNAISLFETLKMQDCSKSPRTEQGSQCKSIPDEDVPQPSSKKAATLREESQKEPDRAKHPSRRVTNSLPKRKGASRPSASSSSASATRW